MPHSNSSADHRARRGATAVAMAFLVWGLLPLYLKPLIDLSAVQISAWRSIMGCVVAISWITWRGELAEVWQVFIKPALLGRLALTSSLLGVNWILYAWGVAHGQVLLTSLGYFINPLVNVLLGVLVLSERLNPAQWTAAALAASGVVALTLQSGTLPWLSLVLAVTFSLYGLLRKTATTAPLTGMAVESLVAAPIAGGYLLLNQANIASIHYTPLMIALLIGSGVITIVPLALFNYGAQRINYATVGMLQYIGPTLQFLIGLFIYKETLSTARLLCFATIWLALIIYAGDSLWRSRGLRHLRQ